MGARDRAVVTKDPNTRLSACRLPAACLPSRLARDCSDTIVKRSMNLKKMILARSLLFFYKSICNIYRGSPRSSKKGKASFEALAFLGDGFETTLPFLEK